MRRTHLLIGIVSLSCVLGGLLPLAAFTHHADAPRQDLSGTSSDSRNSAQPNEDAPIATEPSGGKEGPSSPPLDGVDIDEAKLVDGAYRQTMPDGRVITFTLDPDLQRRTEGIFSHYRVPAAAAVVINSKTGRVLALAQQRLNPDASATDDVAFDASPPAASLFKLITASALLEAADVEIATKTCYCGGSSKLLPSHLSDVAPQDGACSTLVGALGHSINAVFAKLSDRHLAPEDLERYAQKYGFNTALPSDALSIPISVADIPDDRLERARAAAGFWHTHLSPFHAAMIAQSLAQGGAMLRPYVVDSVTLQGTTLHDAEPKFIARTVSEKTARALIDAMTFTVSHGTARRAFHDRKGRPFLPGIEVSGKTGTLTGERPYRAFSWFVAVAPADAPEVALSVLVVNGPKWRIKATDAAVRILQAYFDKH